MDVMDMLKKLAQVLPMLGIAKLGVWAVVAVCLVWLLGKLIDCGRDVLVENARCARDIEVATIENSLPDSRPSDNKHKTRSDRHKKNRHG